MRRVRLTVGGDPIGHAMTWGYPNGDPNDVYVIATYKMMIEGINHLGRAERASVEVLRFGLQDKGAGPRVVGLADQQTHVIKQWIPTYTVRSAPSLERGAWQVYGNFLIHDGPDDPTREVFASIGCVEVCGGPQGFVLFNDLLIRLSGVSGPTRDAQLANLARSGRLSITYNRSVRPQFGAPIEKFGVHRAYNGMAVMRPPRGALTIQSTEFRGR